MFIRTVERQTTKNIAVQIVESYRNRKGQPRQRILRHMGSVPPEAVPALEKLAKLEMQKLVEERKPSLFPPESYAERVIAARNTPRDSGPPVIKDARKLEELCRLCLGFHEIMGTLYDQIGFARVFGSRQEMSRRLFKQAVLLRLAAPGDSKLVHSRQMSKDADVEVPVEKFYRMMDAVTDDRIAQIKRLVSEETSRMLGGGFNVLFFDVTTLSFASENDDELRKKGFSKDGKPHRMQVVLALVQTREGLPVTYELFPVSRHPGNTTDVTPLEPAIKKLKERFELDRMIVVADPGMLSKENLALLQNMGCEYIVAARLRSMNKAHIKVVTQEQSWTNQSAGRKVTEHKLDGRRLILRYCPQKATQDEKTRKKAIEKVKKRFAKGVKGNGRSGRFLRVDQDAVSLDEAAIEKDKKFDGLHGVWTSIEDLTPSQVCQYYGELWRIEEGFRVIKHTMAVHPIFHWKERRVQAHVAICFVAFTLLRILRYRYNTRYGSKHRLNEEQILAELGNVEASVICDRGNHAEYLLPSKPTEEGIRLYRVVNQPLQRQTVRFKEGTTA